MEASKLKLIVGLGNPGASYQWTRHNIGFLVVEELARKWSLSFKEESRFQGRLAKGTVRGVGVQLLMPNTYMNDSGSAVAGLCGYYRIPPNQALVVLDDVALDLGRMRLRERGSSGGHNGLKSIEASLGTNDYPRLRLGIGLDKRQDLADYVLGRFTSGEMQQLEGIIQKAAEIADRWLDEDIGRVMSAANMSESQPENTENKRME